MGHKQSRSQSSISLINDTIPSSKERVVEANPEESFIDDQISCFNCCSSSKRHQNDIPGNKWMRYMIEQLETVGLEVWPKIIVRTLKRYNTEIGESTYQADVFWIFSHPFVMPRQENYSVITVLSQNKMNSEYDEKAMKDESDDSKSILMIPEKKVINEAYISLLNTSHVLDEKFYLANNRESWINKSYNIKLNGEARCSKGAILNRLTVHKSLSENVNREPRGSRAMKRGSKNQKNPNRYIEIEKYPTNALVNNIAFETKQESEGVDELYNKILRYKAVTDMIEKHFKQKGNIFHQLLRKFEIYYQDAYSLPLQKGKMKEIPKSDCAVYLEKATTDLQQFIRIICEGMCLFYKLENLDLQVPGDKETLFNRDNLMSFITSLVFTDAIHNIIFGLVKLQEAKLEEAYRENLKRCKKFKPEDFAVPDKFCLNESTVQYFVKQGMIKGDLISQNQKLASSHEGAFEYDDFVLMGVGNSVLANSHDTPLPKKELYSSGSEKIALDWAMQKYEAAYRVVSPYAEAISTLASLNYRKSPIHKLKTIVKVAELVTKAIKEFYEEFGLEYTEKVDADQTLSIFLFIVSQSGLKDLTVHCKLIEKFSTSNILNSVSGYYSITLVACVEYLSAMTFEDQMNASQLNSSVKMFIQAAGKMSMERLSRLSKSHEK